MVIQGTDLMAWISDSETGTAKSVGGATSHSLTINQSLTSISCKDFGSGRFAQNAIGLLDWSISSSHYVIDNVNNQGAGIQSSNFSTLDDSRYGLGYGEMFDMMVSRKPIFVTFGLEGSSEDYNENKLDHPDSSTNGWKTDKTKHVYWGGYCYITSLALNAPNADVATYDIELVGTGALKKLDVSSGVTENYSVQNPVAVSAKKANAVATEKAN